MILADLEESSLAVENPSALQRRTYDKSSAFDPGYFDNFLSPIFKRILIGTE